MSDKIKGKAVELDPEKVPMTITALTVLSKMTVKSLQLISSYIEQGKFAEAKRLVDKMSRNFDGVIQEALSVSMTIHDLTEEDIAELKAERVVMPGNETIN